MLTVGGGQEILVQANVAAFGFKERSHGLLVVRFVENGRGRCDLDGLGKVARTAAVIQQSGPQLFANGSLKGNVLGRFAECRFRLLREARRERVQRINWWW